MKLVIKKYRKILVMLPCFLIIILFLGYVIKGGIESSKNEGSTIDSSKRFNIALPAPRIEEKNKTKLEAFMQSQADSNKKDDELEPYAKRFFDPGPTEEHFEHDMEANKGNYKRPTIEQQERKVNEQMNRILKELNSASGNNSFSTNDSNDLPAQGDNKPEIARLEALIESLQSGSEPDHELLRLDTMLNKIIQINEPFKLSKIGARPDSNVLIVQKYPLNIGFRNADRRYFFGLDNNPVTISNEKTAIKAVVHSDQTVQDGSTIKLRLIESIYIGQKEIPANTFVYGVCKISDERLIINLKNIVCNNTMYPVSLSGYDMDGIPGIHIPGTITRDASKQGMDQVIQSLSMTGIDPSLTAQATTAGIQTLKDLIRRKVKLVKVTIKAGHQLLLQ
ncbi:conjugative transposon protein TraM [Chitinophaga niabensis]|uniref:Bacteroides conjugative transposon TraM protein n=1 Tax=Chitinophaga niabensis TaxID=536979 RepID=A0A1N6KBC5_9BACT|nr:conjugative transposon protein TraM [Chitinophaga niabensis]SIO53841.1 Bacteroides conjugative transposon TraM protein [Chitinophaga niabensis]